MFFSVSFYELSSDYVAQALHQLNALKLYEAYSLIGTSCEIVPFCLSEFNIFCQMGYLLFRDTRNDKECIKLWNKIFVLD